MGEALPVWERHAWRILIPCTDGLTCEKCLMHTMGADAQTACPGPAKSGPPHRLARWGGACRPTWTFIWPDGQHQIEDADHDEHLQARRYDEFARRVADAPTRAAWLDSHLRAVPPSTWLPPDAPDESAPAPEAFTDASGCCEFCNRHVPDACPRPGSDPCTDYILGDLAAAGIRTREYTPDEALNVALGLHEEGIAGEALGLTDAQVENALREAGKLRAEPDADALERVRRRLPLGGEP